MLLLREACPTKWLLIATVLVTAESVRANIAELPDGLFNDPITPELVTMVNRELPEREAVDAAFLDPSYMPNLVVSQDAQITLTFLDEGAGFRNALGYFAYPRGLFDELTYGDIDLNGYGGISLDELGALAGVDYGLVFPNSSRLHGGGQLQPGDSVTIAGGQTFSAGTEVGFFLLQNGWSNGQVRGYSPNAGSALTFYSLDMLNPENRPSHTIQTPSDENYTRHVAMLFAGQDRDSVIMSFEDLKRVGSNYQPTWAPSDEDFNDAVFRVKSNPIEAIFDTPIPVAIDALPDRPEQIFQVQVCSYAQNAIAEYLPERTNVTAEFLNPIYDPNLLVSETTQIAVTFNDEGASYQNSLGYFSYQEDSIDELTRNLIDTDASGGVSLSELDAVDGVEIGMVFAKASAEGSGGRLLHGDTVLLGDGTEFQPGDRIGFFLVQSGWAGDHVRGYGGDTDDPLVFYTLDMLNPEGDGTGQGDEGLSRHVAMLFANEARESIVMGFEDLHRESSELNGFGYASDEDFNDQIFCVWSIQSQALSDTEIMIASDNFIPEPSTALLSMLGLGLVIGRDGRCSSRGARDAS